ncbi:signal peptidase I [Aliikangiella marina]|uniref:Signal peptidase I n=1 Tax=Aliikangiella marina TaxID=1712262 RepID=A0A545TJ22_9GAMM|nr:signal peptidase I [Aliikangiella marina]TQV77208.1 signal peptidase I [Aliikangiella marina]
MSEPIYQAPNKSALAQIAKPKSFVIFVLVTLLVGPFLGMLYFAKPVRAVFYLVVHIGVFYITYSGLGSTVHDFFADGLYLSLLAICVGDGWLVKKRMALAKPYPLYSRAYVLLPATFFGLLVLFSVRGLFIDFYHLPAASMMPNYMPGDYVIVDKTKSAQTTFAGQSLKVKPNRAMYEMVWRGNVIVFYREQAPDSPFIKRIIGIPNDVVTLKDRGYLIETCMEADCAPVAVNHREVKAYPIPSSEYNPVSRQYMQYKETLGESEFDVLYLHPTEARHPIQIEQNRFVVPEGYIFVMGDHRDNSFDSRYFGLVKIENIIGEVIGAN